MPLPKQGQPDSLFPPVPKMAASRFQSSPVAAVARGAFFAVACGLAIPSLMTASETLGGFDPFEQYDPFGPEADVRPVAHFETSTIAFQETLPAPNTSVTLPTPAAEPSLLPTGERTDPDAPEAKIPIKPLGELTTNITVPGGMLPRDYSPERPLWVPEMFDPCARTRFWPVTPFNWEASCLTHNPLYFEEVNLERHGYGCGCYGPCCSTCVQSVVSGAHFFATVPALPYLMGADCPTECEYTLGHYRPGSCPPWRYTCCTRPSCAGGWSTAGVATGLIFLIP